MTRIQLRHDTATNWTTANPILAEGEVGVETDTNKFKIGDGITTWSELAYQGSNVDLSNYYTKTQTDSLLEEKEDSIVAIAPLNKEQVNLVSQATSTADGGETFTTPNTGNNSPMAYDGGLRNVHIFTTSAGNGIVDKSRIVVCPITPTPDIEYRWTYGGYNSNGSIYYPEIILGNIDDNGYFAPVIVSNYNNSDTTPYSYYCYVSVFSQVNSIQPGSGKYSSGTRYNVNPINLGYVYTGSISPTIKSSKIRCYKNSNNKIVLYVEFTDTNDKTGSHTFTTALDFDEMNINCVLFSTTSKGTYNGNEFGAFNITTGEQIWNPAKENIQTQLSLNIDNSLEVDGNGLLTTAFKPQGVTELNTVTQSEYDALVQAGTLDSTGLYIITDTRKIYFGDTLISNVGNNTLLDFKWTDHQLNDIQWLRADTFSWQSGDVYTSAYNHLVQDIQGITSETETIGSYTVTFYRATDGHKICLADQEQTVLNIYNTYGIAWYYILDTTNTQFKLPRTKYGFEGLRTNVGDNINESLPNIIGDVGTRSGIGHIPSVSFGLSIHNSETSGAFYPNNTCDFSATKQSQQGSDGKSLGFDASRSSSTYQDNAPVQERATQMYLYFYVGDYTQTAIEQTAGLNSELFNNKVDLNFDNMNPSQTAKNTIISWGMPDYGNGIGIVTGTASRLNYTAPSDGVIYGALQTVNALGTVGNLLVNNNIVASTVSYTGNPYCPTTTFVNKGDVITTDCLIYKTYFYPLKGAN